MRIALVTGCLEPGRDGVGDYTRTLAVECARRGHAVALLSIGESGQIAQSPGVESLAMSRMRRNDWRMDGGRAARRWLEAFKPDWASLQFVPYSLDPRGLFAASVDPLNETLGVAPRRQIFFHETWIGSQRGAAWKTRLIGWSQRRAFARMIRVIAPQRMHTSNDYYRAALATIGGRAEVLPMFGSVPVPADGVAPELPQGIDSAALVCGMFGTVHPNWEPDAFLADFAALAAERGRPAALVAAGSVGYGAALFEALAMRWRGRVTCVAAGRCSDDRLARLFARFDFAVTSVPWNILGKSSSTAALREHGVRVVVTAAGSPPRFTAPRLDDPPAHDAGLVPYFREPTLLASALVKTPPRVGVAAVADEFLRSLNAAT